MEIEKNEESPHTHPYSHVHPHDHEHEHSHGHHHSHSHTHDPEKIHAIVVRLARSVGHLESVKKMLENGKDCADILIQLAAVRSEINNAGKLLLKEHMEHCIVEAVRESDQEAIERMNQAIDRFMK